MSETHPSPTAPRSLLVAAAGLALVGCLSATSGCSSWSGNGTSYNFDGPIHAAKPFNATSLIIIKNAKSDTNVRYDDEARSTDAPSSGNTCHVIKDTSIQIGEAALQGHTIYFSSGDSNGPRVGIPLGAMSPEIQEDCEKDRDGYVWVVANHVLTTPGAPKWVRNSPYGST